MKKLLKAQKIGTFDPTKVDMWNPPQSYYPASDRQNAPARQLSAEEIAKQKAAAAEALRLKKLYEQQELARRKQAIASSIEAKDKELTAENFATETGAIGEKLRFFPNDPNSFIDEYINPFKMVGDMASGLGQIPLNLQQGNYGQAALNLALPVTTGLLGGIGAKTTGQFVNNLVNPFTGMSIGKRFPHIANSKLGAKQLPGSGNIPKNATELFNTGFKNDPYYHAKRFFDKKDEIGKAIRTAEGRKRIQAYIDNNPHLQNKTVDDIINDFENTIFETTRPYYRNIDEKGNVVYNPHFENQINNLIDADKLDIAYAYNSDPSKTVTGWMQYGPDKDVILFNVDPNNAYNWYRYGTNDPSFISMGQNYTPYDAMHILEHEFGHLFQRGQEIAGVDDVLGSIALKSNEDLVKKTFKDFFNKYNPFAKKVDDAGYSVSADIYGIGTNNPNRFANLKNHRDYWLYGEGRGQEKAAFAAEVRENLLQRGILKNRYDEITPKMLEDHYKLYHNTQGDKYNLRLYDIMQNNKNNFKYLSDALNKMPAVLPYVGAGYLGYEGLNGAGAMQEQKYGGMIRRKDGSYSRRGLWDNIRDNAGSGKKPTAEMLRQERKIRNEEKEYGGSLPTSTTGVPYQDKEYMYQGGGETENWLTKLLNTPAGNILKQTLADQVNVVGPAYNATTQILENNPSDYARTVNIALEGLKSPAPFWGDLAINALQEGVSYMGKKNPVGIDRSYETHFKNEKGPKYREGGENPEDWTKFTAFNKTLPNNLRDDNFKYGDYSYYDLYGMWEAAGKPNSFKEVKDTEFFPLQDDGLYHGFSVGKDGIVLKSKNHPSVVYEALASQLSPYTKDLLLTQREDGRLQYVPKKQAGGENLIDMYYKGSNYPYRIKDETKRNEHIKNIFFRDLDEIPREYLTEENIEQVKNFFRKKYRGYGTERGYDVGDNYIGFDYKDFDDKMFAKLVEEYLDQVYSDEAPLIVTNGIESILAKQRKNRAKKRDGGSSSEIDPWVEYHKKLKLYNQYNNEEQPEYELIIDKNTFPNEFEEYTQHDEAVKKYTQQAFDNEDLFVKEFAKKYGLETERKTSKDSLRIKGRVPESLSEEFYKGKVKVLEDIMESKDYKDRLNRKYYLNNMYARPNVKLNEYWKTKKDPNFSVDGIKPTSWEEKIIEQGRTMVPIGSNSYGTIYGQPVGNPTTTESTTYYKPIFQKPLMPELKKIPSRAITEIPYNPTEREFVPLDVPQEEFKRNPPQKFYYGSDKKQEKRRLAGKPYTAVNSSGAEIYIASGDTRLDSDPENTIGYNKGRAYVEGDRIEEFEPTRDTQNNPISKEQMGGNIYDKETDNLLAQIASMIADGEDPDMVAGSLVDNGYSEEVVDSLVEEAIDRLSELGDYEEEDINQIEDIKVLREGGIPDRYKNQGFTKVGAKRKSNRPGKKWMVLAKKGNKYKIVHGGYKGMKDYTQHGSEERRERFWDRMGGKNSAKAKDQFSPLYWHKRFGTWQDGGKTPIEHPEGQRKFPGKTTRIPSNRITMEGINYPVLAIGDNGKANLMLPGEEYLYLGVNYVDEVPFSK
jgi:hypothetical protein